MTGPVADVNNDGIADMVFLPAQGGNYFGTALGRGDGSFAILNQTTPVPPAQTGYLLMTGDFNGDGKTDALAIQPGSVGHNALTCVAPDAQLLSYLGSGDGRFQAKGTALALGVSGAGAGATGDFNSDGNLDVILPYNCNPTGLLFLPGHGDGTFGSPIDLNVQGSNNPVPLVGDLNNDKKLDFIWNAVVFLGNGDGTFKQLPLTIPGGSAVVAIADLNGDGTLDVISGRINQIGPGSMIYAGNGDGTFQTTPFYTVPLPAYTYQYSFATGDVNGDGNPDLLVGEQGGAAPYLGVYLGDGHGNFTQDTNTYIVNTAQSFGANPIVPARLNNQAPPSNRDNRLDVVIPLLDSFAATSNITSLLNQTNPVPVKPAPLTSTTTLQTSLATATPGAAITLTASVFGTNPTGSVSFSANGNALGTEALVNGSATLATSFANAGSYTVTAAYEGDSNNTASTSSPVGITITPATSATTLQATPTAGNVNGQITLKASVSGDSPTGSVSFSAGSASLGTATLTNGVATLQTSFSAAGSYDTTATYQGDQNNAASTSSAVTIVIAAPDFTVTATPSSGSVTSGSNGHLYLHGHSCGGLRGHGEIFLWRTPRAGSLLVFARKRDAVGWLPSDQHTNGDYRGCYGRAQSRSAFRAIAAAMDPCRRACSRGRYGLRLRSQNDRALESAIASAQLGFVAGFHISVCARLWWWQRFYARHYAGRFVHHIGKRHRQRGRSAACGEHRVDRPVEEHTSGGLGCVRAEENRRSLHCAALRSR